jgi:aryl sulfotransferase
VTDRRRYVSLVSDSARWDDFAFRAGDIVISTPPKCGTTWTQTLCAYLILGTELERPLADISPWLDMQINAAADVLAMLEAQDHRRFIKTHTPLDGLPYDDRVTYICVGRDPRDVAVSWEHHQENFDVVNFINARAAAVGLDDLEGLEPPAPPTEDPLERFWAWVDGDTEFTNMMTLSSMLEHLETFWDVRHRPNIALFHYADLLTDLPGEIGRLADVLGIEVSEQRAAELAAAGSFASMKARADSLIPERSSQIFLDNSSFFHTGTSGQWRHLLDDAGLERYEKRVAEVVPPDLAAWAHAGWLGVP